jgi:protein involved in polysaccharide export with SLBB domain
VLGGFAGSFGPNHCINPGDQLSVSVWNAQIGGTPSVYSVVAAGGGSSDCATAITSVSPIVSAATQTITIAGTGFGTHAAYSGVSAYIQLQDLSGTPWSAGYTGNGLTLGVSSWTNTQILLSGLGGNYGTTHCIRPGDSLLVSVWNAQTGVGPVEYPVVASGTIDNCPTAITSISAVLPQQTQTITITGEGFGSQAAYTGDSAYIQVTDTTRSWTGGHTGNGITLGVTSWTDSKIVLSGFGGSFGTNHCIAPGDHLSFSVWNAGTGAGPVVYPVVASSGTSTCP